jgi:hypothetical protein
MKTDDLIRHLGANPAAVPFRSEPLVIVVTATVAVCSILFLALLGVRPDFLTALQSPVVAAKTAIPASIFILSLCAVVLSARPAFPEKRPGRAAAIPALVAAGLWIWAFASLPPDRRFAEVGAISLSECVGLITLLSVLPSVVIIALLRNGATLSPRRSAFLAGLAASSGATTGYSFFCIQDNPLFYVTWYGAAMLIVAFMTAWLAERFLRW